MKGLLLSFSALAWIILFFNMLGINQVYSFFNRKRPAGISFDPIVVKITTMKRRLSSRLFGSPYRIFLTVLRCVAICGLLYHLIA
ncbi:hypothetical protein DXN05_15535 [Deminuibacter soli]|uniref:Uncharacterized protein n=1 Tax=Deminuibacter soli TaxID=2291815 RepID=A0A3E1NHL0_9BACT|nr:hypothetical protein DXN05_15535 [Deminuibacter soli]